MTVLNFSMASKQKGGKNTLSKTKSQYFLYIV